MTSRECASTLRSAQRLLLSGGWLYRGIVGSRIHCFAVSIVSRTAQGMQPGCEPQRATVLGLVSVHMELRCVVYLCLPRRGRGAA